jgi:hypothetical protein
MSQSSFGSRFSRGSIVAFGTWTILAQGAVLVGGTPRQLSIFAAFLLALLAGGTLMLRRKRPAPQTLENAIPKEAGQQLPQRSSRWPAMMTYCLGMAMLVLVAFTTGPEILAAAVALLAAGILVVEIRHPLRWTPPEQSIRTERFLLIFALFIGLLALSAHRPDADDAMYLNLATTTADYPSRALLSFDGSLPDAGVPLPEAAYRAHTLEILAGLLTLASGFSAISILHIGIVFWATLLTVFAQAELQKILLPRQWLLGTIVAILILLALGETHRAYGNFAFVRMHQGKGILLTAVVPLLITYALHFMRTPSSKNWWLLLLSVIAAGGISSAGLVIGPATAAIALLSAWSPDRESTQKLAVGLATGLYPVLLSLLLGLG